MIKSHHFNLTQKVIMDFQKQNEWESSYKPTLRIADVTNKTIKIVWLPDLIESGFVVNHFLLCESYDRKKFFHLSSSECEILNLEPNTHYKFAIYSIISPSNTCCLTDPISVHTKPLIFTLVKLFSDVDLKYNVDRLSLSIEEKTYIYELIEKLESCIKDKIIYFKHIPYQLVIFGSVKSGFGIKKSDVDITFLVDETEYRQYFTSIDHFLKVFINNVLKPMKEHFPKFFMISETNTKVPVVKFSHYNDNIVLDIDLSLNNKLGIRNTEFLASCSKIPLVHQLGILFKHWAKVCGFAEVVKGGISSYGIIILLLYFLKTTKQLICINDDFSVYAISTQKTLLDIWKEILSFYTEFAYEKRVIDLNDLTKQKKTYQTYQWESVVVLDPFEENFNLARKITFKKLQEMRSCFKSTVTLLEGDEIKCNDNIQVINWFKELKYSAFPSLL